VRRPSWPLIGLALAACTFAAYGAVRGHGPVDLDDPSYVFANPHVRGGLTLDGLRWALGATRAANWHPLTWASHMADVSLWGLDPGGHHLTSLILHAGNAVLLLWLLVRWTGSTWAAALAAALFALHPLHVESVAWIAERKDVLSLCLALLTLIAYTRHVARPSPGSYALTTLLFAAGLAAKPMLVTLPLLMLLLDLWPLARLRLDRPGSCRGPVREKLPWLVLAALSAAVTFVVQRGGGAVHTLAELPLPARLANAPVAAAAYLGQVLWPVDLAVFYPHPHLAGGLPAGRVAGAAALLVALSAAAWALRRWGYPLVGWLWFVGALVPVIGLVQVGEQARADRYTYLPAIGLYVVAAFGLRDLAAARPRLRPALATAALAALAALGATTHAQVAHWRDSVALFSHAAAVTSGNFLAQLNLGGALLQRGDRAGALAAYHRAVELRPDYAHARASLGALLLESGDQDGARTQLELALAAQPDHPVALFNLGWLAERTDPAGAAARYEAALRADPDHVGARLNLGVLLARRGDLDAAGRHFRHALDVRPDDGDALLDLGLLAQAYAAAGRLAAARATAAEALRRATAGGREDVAAELRGRLRGLL